MKVKYDTVIMFKVTSKLKKEIEDKAYSNGQTVSDYLRGLIIKDVRA